MYIQCVPLATELGISLIILPLMRILQRNLKQTTDTFLFISHTTNLLLFKFRCNIFIDVTIIKEMPGSVASGTRCMLVKLRRVRITIFAVQKAIIITCVECWTYLSSTPSACAIWYCLLWPVCIYCIFPHYHIKGTIFEKKNYWT